MSKRSVIRVVAVAALVVFLDQLSKQLILRSFSPAEIVEVIPGLFNLTLHFNPGVAFGLLSGIEPPWRHVILSVTTVLALGLVVYFLLNDYLRDAFGQVALALIIGGAFGNIIDRFRFGEVVDFLDFYYRSYHWPAFNLADSCICVGVLLLLIWRR